MSTAATVPAMILGAVFAGIPAARRVCVRATRRLPFLQCDFYSAIGRKAPALPAARISGVTVMAVADGLRQARAACEQAFAFLVTDLGYRRDTRRFQWHGFLLRYRGPVVGVKVAWYPRDELTVWLVKLVDGGFPAYPVTIHPDTELHYFDLGDLEALSGYHRQVSQRQLYALPSDHTARPMADSLRGCAADLLRGDLTRLPLLEQRIRDRARTYTIALWGAEYARELGW